MTCVTCEYEIAGACGIATSLSGVRAPTNPGACIACRNNAKPKQLNETTALLGLLSLRGRRTEQAAYMDEHKDLLPQFPKMNESRLTAVVQGAGVGSQLWRLLASLGIKHQDNCTCLGLAERMNLLGPAGCRTERDGLLAQMRENAGGYGWGDVAKAAMQALATGLAWRLDLKDVLGSLLDESIARAEAVPEKQRLILKTKLCPGDLLTLTAAIESLHATYPGVYETDVRTNHPEIWRGSPHILPIADADKTARAIEMHYPSIQRCNQESIPFLGGYTEYLGEQLGVPLRLRTNRPHLYLTPAELQIPRTKLWRGAPDLSKPFWLVNAGVKKDFPVKGWPMEYFQEVVDRTKGRITWLQVGLRKDQHRPLRGVIDLLEYGPPMRELILLAYHAAGGLGPITFLQHLCAAWEKPYICLAGGREPTTWIQYAYQHTLHTVGALDCCRPHSCWAGKVTAKANDKDKLCAHPVTNLERPAGRCMVQIQPVEVLALLSRLAP